VAGRSPYLNAVHLPGPRELIGRVVRARVLAAGPNSLAGEQVAARGNHRAAAAFAR
jgi:tRNA-2-methylthio-N6-dimethylallyladenosine synthase